jgi:hypothetical protein
MDRSLLRPLAKIPPRREHDARGGEWSTAHMVRQDVLDYSARLARVEGRPESELTPEELHELRHCRYVLRMTREGVEKRAARTG